MAESASAVAESAPNPSLDLLNYLELADALRRRGYMCKKCDCEEPLKAFEHIAWSTCSIYLCCAMPSGAFAACTDCRAVVCAECIVSSDLVTSAESHLRAMHLAEYHQVMAAEPGVRSELLSHFWRSRRPQAPHESHTAPQSWASPAVARTCAAQAAQCDLREAAASAVAGRHLSQAALCDLPEPCQYLPFRGQAVRYKGYDCYWDDECELWAYDASGGGHLKWWKDWRLHCSHSR